MPEIVLIHSPLLGPNSLAPTAAALRAQGVTAHLPSPLAGGGEIPPWRDWPQRLGDALPVMTAPIFVGHSMASRLAACLSAGFDRSAVLCLDADRPPESGATSPVTTEFRAFLETLPLDAGRLPPWHRWWPNDVLEGTGMDEIGRTGLLADIPRLPLAWFDDDFTMPDWSHAGRAYVRTSLSFVEEARRAESDGWAVVRLKGTHIHPAAEPGETAAAILQCCRTLLP